MSALGGLFCLLLFLQHLILCFMQSGLLIHFVGVDLIHISDFNSIELAVELDTVEKAQEKAILLSI